MLRYWLLELAVLVLLLMDLNARHALQCQDRLMLWGMTYTSRPWVRTAGLVAAYWALVAVMTVERLQAHSAKMPHSTVGRYLRSFLENPAHDPIVDRVVLMCTVTALWATCAFGWSSLCGPTLTTLMACGIFNIRLVEHFAHPA